MGVHWRRQGNVPPPRAWATTENKNYEPETLDSFRSAVPARAVHRLSFAGICANVRGQRETADVLVRRVLEYSTRAMGRDGKERRSRRENPGQSHGQRDNRWVWQRREPNSLPRGPDSRRLVVGNVHGWSA